MKINELHIGDTVCQKDDRFPMVVVGLHSTLDELSKGQGDVYLDFEGNEGDMWEHKPEELERVNTLSADWNKIRINTAIANMQTLMVQSWQMEADEVAKVAVKYADALIKELKK
jgi:hypothetical protein